MNEGCCWSDIVGNLKAKESGLLWAGAYHISRLVGDRKKLGSAVAEINRHRMM